MDLFTISDFKAGQRIALHPASDQWARGIRFGTVVSVRRSANTIRVRSERNDKSDIEFNLSPRNVSEILPFDRPAVQDVVLADIEVSGIGESVLLFIPKTAAGGDWLDDRVQSNAWQWLGGALGVEHRFAGRLIESASNDGLRVRVL